jgi:hypothetical protein
MMRFKALLIAAPVAAGLLAAPVGMNIITVMADLASVGCCWGWVPRR